MKFKTRNEYYEHVALAEDAVDLDKEIWEGWTVLDFIEALKPEIDLIMTENSWKKPFKSKKELTAWCADNQPYYKFVIPEVIKYFSILYGVRR